MPLPERHYTVSVLFSGTYSRSTLYKRTQLHYFSVLTLSKSVKPSSLSLFICMMGTIILTSRVVMRIKTINVNVLEHNRFSIHISSLSHPLCQGLCIAHFCIPHHPLEYTWHFSACLIQDGSMNGWKVNYMAYEKNC